MCWLWWQQNVMIHVHPVNHRSHGGDCRTPSHPCCRVRSESGCSHSIDKALLLDATSTDALRLISLIHLDIPARLKQIHCICNVFPGVQIWTTKLPISRSDLFVMLDEKPEKKRTCTQIFCSVVLRIYVLHKFIGRFRHPCRNCHQRLRV